MQVLLSVEDLPRPLRDWVQELIKRQRSIMDSVQNGDSIEVRLYSSRDANTTSLQMKTFTSRIA